MKKKNLSDEESQKLKELIKANFRKISDEKLTKIITDPVYREGFFLGIDLAIEKLNEQDSKYSNIRSY
jgi:hypothetical protein